MFVDQIPSENRFHALVFNVVVLCLFSFRAANAADTSDVGEAINKCVGCHGSHPELPVSLKDKRAIVLRLVGISDGTLEEMIRRGHFTPTEKTALEDFVRRSREETPSNVVASQGPTCHSKPSDNARSISRLPEIMKQSSRLAEALGKGISSGNLMFYDRASVPRTWLSDAIDGVSPRLYSSRFRTNSYMYNESGYFSDAGTEFPWLTGAGLDSSVNGFADRFVIPGAQPFLRLVTRIRKTDPSYFGMSDSVNGPNLGWTYSEGTLFGEVLKVSGIPFEIRLRQKTSDGWVMDVLRPFESPADLAAGLRRICSGDKVPAGCSQVGPSLLKQIEQPNVKLVSRSELINAEAFKTKRDPLSLNSTAVEATLEKVMLHELPELPEDVRAALLAKTSFKSVFGKPWIKGTHASWAPTCRSQNCVVPQNYFAGFIPMTQKSCMNCHDSAGRHVENFNPGVKQMFAPSPREVGSKRPRTWYGHVSGDDAILSFHPFRADAVAKTAAATQDAINDCLVKSDLVSPRRLAPVLGGLR